MQADILNTIKVKKQGNAVKLLSNMNIAIKCLDFAISIEVSEYCHNNRTSYPTFTFNIESKIIIIVSGQLQIHVS